MCNCKNNYSNFSLLGICFDAKCKRDKQIAVFRTQCEQANPGDQEGIDGCVAGATSRMDAEAAAQPATSSSNTLTDLLGILGIGQPKPAATYPAPLPPQNKLIFGVDPTVLVVGGIIGVGIITTVLVIALKGKSK